MTESDNRRLDPTEQESFVDALVARSRGEAGAYPVAPSSVDPGQLERLAERAASRTGDPESVWNAVGDALVDGADRDRVVAEAVERVRESPASAGDGVETDGGHPPERNVDWDAIGGEVAQAIVEDMTGGPVDHERTAIFKARLQKGGRVSVPEPEIEALDVDPGDLLQVRLRKVDENP